MANDKTNPIKDFDPSSTVKTYGGGTVSESVSKVSLTSTAISIDTAIGDNFYGINHRQEAGAVPINKDGHGLTFITRPAFNLSAPNIRGSAMLHPLLNTNPNSIQRIIRAYLDPRLAREGVPCGLVDPNMAFIPVLTNNLLGISGWPDVENDTFTSQPGVYKEAWFMVDTLAQNLSTYDITMNFRNIEGDPITYLFFIWAHYASLVYTGELVPYPEYIVENEIDYLTRIYRLVLDKDKRFVQKIGATGIAVPLSSPIGASFNHDAASPLNKSNDQLSITFRCAGALYMDTRLIWAFNTTVAYFNSDMDSKKFSAKRKNPDKYFNEWEFTHSSYKQVPLEALGVFNNRGYPRIMPENNELTWWVPADLYKERYAIYLNQSGK